MEVFRLCREKFAKPLSGKGAALGGGRWNSKGIELIYTAANRSLAMAEVAVHFTVATTPPDYVMMTIFLPDDLPVRKINIVDLPDEWNLFPYSSSTQKIGDEFVAKNKFCLLQVPSAVTWGDYNFLINPNYPGFSKIKILEIEKFPLDKRIFY
jgi:RES domain-containing protein